MKLEPDYIERLAKIINDNGLTEISLEDGEQAITIRKDLPGMIVPPSPIPVSAAPTQTQNAKTDSEDSAQEAAHTGKAITSPMVGTFYKAASPDAPAFVEVGSLVAQGEVVCIIEAMKLMNEIESDFSGKVVEICVDDGQPVEYGQVLMYIE